MCGLYGVRLYKILKNGCNVVVCSCSIVGQLLIITLNEMFVLQLPSDEEILSSPTASEESGSGEDSASEEDSD